MEISVSEAKARLSELIRAARSGRRVIITRYGEPAVEIVRYEPTGGIDFDKLDASRLRLGVEMGSDRWPSALDDPGLGRRVLGLE